VFSIARMRHTILCTDQAVELKTELMPDLVASHEVNNKAGCVQVTLFIPRRVRCSLLLHHEAPTASRSMPLNPTVLLEEIHSTP
jgi:hypothetical protein